VESLRVIALCRPLMEDERVAMDPTRLKMRKLARISEDHKVDTSKLRRISQLCLNKGVIDDSMALPAKKARAELPACGSAMPEHASCW
jgi:hypothetical protein